VDNSKVTVAYLHGETVAAKFMTSFTDMIRYDDKRRINNIITKQSSVNINMARNNLVRDFISQTDDGWLLMLDADMVVPKRLVRDLLDNITDYEETPIVSGLMFSANENFILIPHIYHWAPEESDAILASSREYPRNTMLRVGAVGAACLLVHRYALAAIYNDNQGNAMPWFEETIYKNQLIGEDFTFSLRAKALGIPVYVNTGVKIGHVKHVTLDERLYDRQLRLEKTYE
jgi:GT2 family glycosyltransferase